MGIAVDSSVLIRYFIQDGEHLAQKSVELIENAEPGSLVLDRIILAEIGYVLRASYGFRKNQLCIIYNWLLGNPLFTVTDRELTELTISLLQSEKPLSFEDCWLLALKKAGRVTDIATFDASLKKRTQAF